MKLSAWNKFALWAAPRWTLNRMRARKVVEITLRHYEAAQPGRRTSGWQRTRGDANTLIATAGNEVRIHARDLLRNNPLAQRGQRVIANNTIGWGVVPKAGGPDAARANEIWKSWAGTIECDAEAKLTFYGIQHLALSTVVGDGEVLVRRRRRLASDGLTVPLQIQLLEADYLDTSMESQATDFRGPIRQGIEFDKIGRRVAYWLFPDHPGSSTARNTVSKRVPAEDILHIYRPDRPGQDRGMSWFASSVLTLKDLDEYEDADLLKQKIAACFAAFVEDDGASTSLGEEDESDALKETFEPGMIEYLPAGKKVTFGNPPTVNEGTFSQRHVRRIAAGLGVTYEDLSGDYSQVNFSSARMSRLSHWANVHDWQWNMIIPQLCDGVWRWVMEAAMSQEGFSEVPPVDWTTPPMPMIEPDKEGLALQRLVRNGVMTHGEMVRERGGDPEAHFQEYAEWLKKLDELGIKLDSDVRAVSSAGLTQERNSGGNNEKS